MDIDANNEYEIIWSPQFFKELRVICNYISYTINEYVIAENLYLKVINSISTLKYFPERHQIIKKYHNKIFRKLVIDKYIIIYEVKEKYGPVHILHIFRENQDYLKML